MSACLTGKRDLSVRFSPKPKKLRRALFKLHNRFVQNFAEGQALSLQFERQRGQSTKERGATPGQGSIRILQF